MSKKVKGKIYTSKSAKKKDKPAETHQQATHTNPILTTAQGTAISDDQNSLRIGAKGPTLLEDFNFREKIFQPKTNHSHCNSGNCYLFKILESFRCSPKRFHGRSVNWL